MKEKEKKLRLLSPPHPHIIEISKYGSDFIILAPRPNLISEYAPAPGQRSLDALGGNNLRILLREYLAKNNSM